MRIRWIAFLEILALSVFAAKGEDVCRTAHYLPRRQGKRLTAHIIRSVDVNTDSNCQIKCFLETFCVSYNIGQFQGGKHVCELSNSDAIRHPQDLVTDPTYTYVETENACTSSPCPSNANCSSLSETDFRCVCPPGYTGANCETDIDECARESHTCDASANCTNNKGSYECTCQLGFTGDGFTCADVDECTSGNHNCDVHASCTNTRGSHTCTCHVGFLGDGTTCAATNCLTIKQNNSSATDGLYQLTDEGNPSNVFPAYCDMTSFGGGWTMCYTTNDRADPKDETTYDVSLPYGTNGYRTNCNGIEFTEIIFIDEETKQKEYFSGVSGQKIKPINSYSVQAQPQGLWTAHGLADGSYSYQLMICDNSFYSGFHVSGFTNNCYKMCGNWCGDNSSPYFRTSSTHPSYSGVAFNINGHNPNRPPTKLVSVGLR